MAADAPAQGSTGPGGTDEPVIDLLADVWASTADLIAELDEDDFATPSPLAGWTVKDCLSHVIGTERSLLGDPPPEVDISHLEHVASPFQELMEVWVEDRRATPGAAVRDEFAEVVPRRLDQLRAMTPDELAEPGWSPVGEVPYREFMKVRVFDCWMHEQDMRRALGRPGHESGPVADSALENITRALGFIVGKKAGAPDGASVVFRTTGGNRIARVVVVDGRASVVPEAPADPTVVLTMPFTTFVALGGGRIDADAALAEGATVEGDAELGRRVLESMAFTP